MVEHCSTFGFDESSILCERSNETANGAEQSRATPDHASGAKVVGDAAKTHVTIASWSASCNALLCPDSVGGGTGKTTRRDATTA